GSSTGLEGRGRGGPRPSLPDRRRRECRQRAFPAGSRDISVRGPTARREPLREPHPRLRRLREHFRNAIFGTLAACPRQGGTGMATAMEQVAAAKAGIENLTPADVAAEIERDDVLLVDLREPTETAQEIIAGALTAPRGMLEFY